MMKANIIIWRPAGYYACSLSADYKIGHRFLGSTLSSDIYGDFVNDLSYLNYNRRLGPS